MARPIASTSRVSATIAEGTRIRGRVSGDGSLLVLGQIDGDVALRGDLTVAGGAEVKANLEVDAVTIEGQVEGNVQAAGIVHVTAVGSLQGDVQGGEFQLDEGGAFRGQLAADFELPTSLGPLPSASAHRR